MCNTEPHIPESHEGLEFQKSKAQRALERAKEIEARHKRRAVKIPFGYKLIKVTK